MRHSLRTRCQLVLGGHRAQALALLAGALVGCGAASDAADAKNTSAGPSASVPVVGGVYNAGSPPATTPGGLTAGGGSSDDGASTGSAAAEGAGFGGATTVPSVIAPSSSSTASPPPSTPQSGLLTAGLWDDNLNYERFRAYRDDTSQLTGVLPFTDAELDAAHDSAKDAPHATLDVALVVDTTGSMGDEIRYLQSEFLAIARSIEAAYPNAAQRWALVAYRDQGDDYVTRTFDFRSDLDAFLADLAAQSADGGGDFPEAPEAAFKDLNQLHWRAGAENAKLAFWVADAPHHDERAGAFAAAVRSVAAQGVHVYPVASSGVDELTERSMRTVAQLSHGRYAFLTDDSGVGGAHKEPSIPCYFVTHLDDAILRMVDVELTGTYRAPGDAEIVRSVGEPKDGVCTLTSGDTVHAY